MNLQKTILKKKQLLRRKCLMKAHLNAYFGMKCSYRSKSTDIPSRNTEDSIIDKKKILTKINILNAYFVIKLSKQICEMILKKTSLLLAPFVIRYFNCRTQNRFP